MRRDEQNGAVKTRKQSKLRLPFWTAFCAGPFQKMISTVAFCRTKDPNPNHVGKDSRLCVLRLFPSSTFSHTKMSSRSQTRFVSQTRERESVPDDMFCSVFMQATVAEGACDLAVTRSVPPHTANQRARLLHRHALLNSWSGVSISQWFDCVKECVEEERSLSTPRKRGVPANSANCVRVGGGA